MCQRQLSSLCHFVSSLYLQISLSAQPSCSVFIPDSHPKCPASGRLLLPWGQGRACVHAYVPTHVWKPEANLKCLPPSHSTLYFEAESLIKRGAHQFSYIHIPRQQTPGMLLTLAPCAGISAACHCTWLFKLTWLLVIKLRASHLLCKHFRPSHFPQSTFSVLKLQH